MTCSLCGLGHRDSTHFEVLPAPRDAWPWMRESFRYQLLELPGGPRECASQQMHALGRVLRTNAGQAVVVAPRGFPEEFVGWAASLDGALVFAYVREPWRRKGLGLEMLTELRLRLPLTCAYWTQSAEAIAGHGFPISYDIHAYRALLAFVRGKEPPTHLTERAA